MATVRRHRGLPPPALVDRPPPTGAPLDHERVVQVGGVLQSCYPEREDTLDDKVTALMLRLTVEPAPPPPTRRR
ncbi:MAG: hypothetical protein V4475_07335 [Pseudomonadota bacterium]